MTTPASPTVLITGATDGIGRETAHQIARRGASVLLHGRDADRLRQVHQALERQCGRAMPPPVAADLSSLDEVRDLARRLDASGVAIHVLVNNAGVYLNERRLTGDGIEQTMAVNHFAPFLLTHLVLAGQSGKALRRVVNVASIAHNRGRLDLEDLKGERRFDPYGTYAASKLANVLFTVELARRLAPRKVAVNALHPGVVSTKLLTEGFGMRGQDSVEDAAATSVMLALDPIGERSTGKYFAYRREAPTHPAARDAALVKRFYEESAKIVGVEPLPEP